MNCRKWNNNDIPRTRTGHDSTFVSRYHRGSKIDRLGVFAKSTRSRMNSKLYELLPQKFIVSGPICGREMTMEVGGKSKMPIWQCIKRYCNGVRSVCARNLFFVSEEETPDKKHAWLSVRTILDIVFKWVYCIDEIQAVSFLVVF